MSDSPKTCYAIQLGTVAYKDALDLQMQICAAKKSGYAPDFLLLLEHPPTITLGRSGKWTNLLGPEEVLRARGVARVECDRGGDITFHGPGQLVGYPILELGRGERDVHRYMRNLEETLIRALDAFGIASGRIGEFTGVWTAQGKIAAMGVHISRWITRHGFALNVRTDLSYFDLIRPCGIADKGVTSMEAILGPSVDFAQVPAQVTVEFGRVFQRQMVDLRADILKEELDGVLFKHRQNNDNNLTTPQVVWS